MPSYDWKIVQELDPKGWVYVDQGIAIRYGRVQCVSVDTVGIVRIQAEFIFELKLDRIRIPTTDWKVVSAKPECIFKFPGKTLPFEIKHCKEKGKYVAFDGHTLYVHPSDGVHGNKFKATDAIYPTQTKAEVTAQAQAET